MEKQAARQLLVDIARRDIGNRETSHNQGLWIKKYWPDTSYPEGYKNREPYCAAACCHWLATWGRELAQMGELRNTLGMGLAEFERWRCKSAGAWRWLNEWAESKAGVMILPENARILPGDFMVFDISHIALVQTVLRSGKVLNVEANTNAGGSREGDGCMEKQRPQTLARAFLRVLP